ncbi:hypothetical protein, partial [Vibrio paucivorans]
MKYIFLMATLATPLVGLTNVPEGFEDFYEEELAKISIQLSEQASTVLEVYISAGTVRIPVSSKSKLQSFLTDNYVSESAASSIVAQLEQGVDDSLYCVGRRDTCQVEGAEDTQYVIVKESQLVRIFVPSEDMVSTNQQEQRFISERFGDSALIMHHNLNINGSDANSPSVYYQNEAFLGYEKSYLRADMVFATTNNNRLKS